MDECGTKDIVTRKKIDVICDTFSELKLVYIIDLMTKHALGVAFTLLLFTQTIHAEEMETIQSSRCGVINAQSVALKATSSVLCANECETMTELQCYDALETQKQAFKNTCVDQCNER